MEYEMKREEDNIIEVKKGISKVYIVQEIGGYIVGVFGNRVNAQKYCFKLNDDEYTYRVEEFPIMRGFEAYKEVTK